MQSSTTAHRELLAQTAHIAWATPDGRRRNLEISVQNLRAFVDGKPQNLVSQPGKS